MADDSSSNIPPSNFPAWDKNLIYETLGNPARRELLLALARNGAQPAADIMGNAKLRRDAAIKHLAIMRAAGLVVVQENSRDGRKQLYSLSPAVPLVKTDKGAVLEFGFITVRL